MSEHIQHLNVVGTLRERETRGVDWYVVKTKLLLVPRRGRSLRAEPLREALVDCMDEEPWHDALTERMSDVKIVLRDDQDGCFVWCDARLVPDTGHDHWEPGQDEPVTIDEVADQHEAAMVEAVRMIDGDELTEAA